MTPAKLTRPGGMSQERRTTPGGAFLGEFPPARFGKFRSHGRNSTAVAFCTSERGS